MLYQFFAAYLFNAAILRQYTVFPAIVFHLNPHSGLKHIVEIFVKGVSKLTFSFHDVRHIESVVRSQYHCPVLKVQCITVESKKRMTTPFQHSFRLRPVIVYVIVACALVYLSVTYCRTPT